MFRPSFDATSFLNLAFRFATAAWWCDVWCWQSWMVRRLLPLSLLLLSLWLVMIIQTLISTLWLFIYIFRQIDDDFHCFSQSHRYFFSPFLSYSAHTITQLHTSSQHHRTTERRINFFATLYHRLISEKIWLSFAFACVRRFLSFSYQLVDGTQFVLFLSLNPTFGAHTLSLLFCHFLPFHYYHYLAVLSRVHQTISSSSTFGMCIMYIHLICVRRAAGEREKVKNVERVTERHINSRTVCLCVCAKCVHAFSFSRVEEEKGSRVSVHCINKININSVA